MTADGTEVVDLSVGAVAHGGHCVARLPDGRVVFVRHALPGERVRAVLTGGGRGFLRADAIEVVQASPDRVAPPCPWAGPARCGGCDWQHVTPAAQRELKAAVVREQLVRLGGHDPADFLVRVQPLPVVDGEPEGLGWRTRVQYSVDGQGRAGLLAHRSHDVITLDECRLAHPAVRATDILTRRWPGVDGVEVAAGVDGEVTVLTRRGRGAPRRVGGPALVRQRAAGRDFRVPADGFWQVHPAAADTLARAVVDLIDPRDGERGWDLYGGVGLFAAAVVGRLGPRGRVTVVESHAGAVDAARRDLADLPVVRVVEAEVRRWLAAGDTMVDFAILDPPRAGAEHDVVRAVAARTRRAVVYVACDPAAFARDVARFRAVGWRLSRVHAFDLFPMTHHVETVGLLLPDGGRVAGPGPVAHGDGTVD